MHICIHQYIYIYNHIKDHTTKNKIVKTLNIHIYIASHIKSNMETIKINNKYKNIKYT